MDIAAIIQNILGQFDIQTIIDAILAFLASLGIIISISL